MATRTQRSEGNRKGETMTTEYSFILEYRPAYLPLDEARATVLEWLKRDIEFQGYAGFLENFKIKELQTY